MADGMEASFCSCEYDWDDPPSFWDSREVSARKEYKCCECGATIVVGERHEYVVGKWDGHFDTYRSCATCARIRKDYCAYYTGLRIKIWEHLGVDYVTGKTEDDEDDVG